jgi:hypothetical protein
LYEKLTIAVPLVAALLFIFVISVMFRTACTDPGILPRSERDEVLYNEKQVLIASKQSTKSSRKFQTAFQILIFVLSEFNRRFNEQSTIGKQHANAALQRSQSEGSNCQIEILLHGNENGFVQKIKLIFYLKILH